MARLFVKISAWSLPGFIALLALAFGAGALFAHVARKVDATPIRVDRFEGGEEPPLRVSSAVEGGGR